MREKKELWKNKRRYRQFVREIPETTDEKETWNWLRKADLKPEAKAMCCAKIGYSSKLCETQDR